MKSSPLEILCGWSERFLSFGDDCALSELACGYYAGIAVTVLLFLLVLFLYWLIFRRVPYCHGIVRKMPHGVLRISSHAVSDLIRSLESGFDYLEIGKVYLIRKKHGRQVLEIHVNYQYSASARPLHDLVEQLQARSLQVLSDSFGIDSVESVSVIAGRAKSVKASF